MKKAQSCIIALLAVLVGEVEPLVEDPELVARADRAGEIDVPGEDVGEVARELGALAERLDRVVQRAGDHSGDPHLARLWLRAERRPAAYAVTRGDQ